MSMTQLTILQCLGVFSAYSFLTLVLPSFVLHNIVKGRRLLERMLFYFICGNFYMANIVYLLELLHISYRFTLVAATIFIAVFLWLRLNGKSFRTIYVRARTMVYRMVTKQLGMRTVRYQIFGALWQRLKQFLKRIAKGFLTQFPDLALCAGVCVGLGVIYGSYLLTHYGYEASDIPVHLYWINELSNNNIFVAGVYPYGYHCIIYFMHEVFGFDSYMMMRVMGFVQTCFIYFMLLWFLKLCAKSRFLPYVGVYIYLFADCFGYLTYLRYSAALPQEFGMLFILPCAFYAFRFFEEYREELRNGSAKKKYRLDLAGLVMSFAMTLSVHFYGTMIAGLFCVAIGIGYFYLTLRPKYLGKLVVAAFASIFIAVLPMGIAFATGTPLQGSLGWGMSIINGSSDEEASGDASGDTAASDDNTVYEGTVSASGNADASGNAYASGDASVSGDALASGDAFAPNDTADHEPDKSTVGLPTRIMSALKTFEERLWDQMLNHDLESQKLFINNTDWMHDAFRWCVAILLAEGLLFIIVRRPCYGSMLWSTVLFWLMMDVLVASGKLGIPSLMDYTRSAIYYAYIIVIPFVFAADGVLALLFRFIKWKWPMHLLSLGATLCVLYGIYDSGSIHGSPQEPLYQTNEAITCLTNIIAQEEDEKWTICSAGDETQMVFDHGWHYEIIDFLRGMEYSGENGYITIPTEVVYVFIEKIPVDVGGAYGWIAEPVSEEGALLDLPVGNSNDVYKGKNRFICMSRMYYWAQEFQKLYPNEMKVYFENDNFICYRIEQNTYRLYNFAIDYGYNMQ
jgi:hypothetical protein